MQLIDIHPTFALFFGVLLTERGIELIIARRNERWLKARGGREYGQGLTRIIVLFHILWLAGFFLEAWVIDAQPQVSPIFPFLALAVLQAGRYWCIASLGRHWNTKVIVIPDAPLQRRGPYRWLRHPNYWIVRLEIIAYPLLFGCWRTAIIGGTVNLVLLHFRIRQEEEALRYGS